MNNTANILRLAVIFAIAMLLQLVVLDNIDSLGPCNPLVYIIVVMAAPFGCPPILLMLISAAAGLAVDIASSTPGMHMAACVLIGFVRTYVLRLLAFRSAYKDDDMPSAAACGSLWFFKYTIIMVAVHHVALFLIEQFDSFYLVPTLIRIALSVVASTVIIILFDMAMPRPAGYSAD